MADIDFDELDKAVSDLMANVDASKRPAGLDEPEEKVVTITASSAPSQVSPTPPVSPVETPAVASSAPAPVTSSPSVAPTPASPSLAVKRRGQFMDIVHPTRDMNGPKPASRQGVTIQPGNDVMAPSANQQSETPKPAPTPPQEQPAEAPSPLAWPDPIDMAGAASTPVSQPSPTSGLSESLTDSTDEAPLTSPFLPDAKPEKRPLGGSLQPEDVNGAPEPVPTDDSSSSNPETPPPAILPEEFSGDLMAVESRDLSTHADSQPIAPAAPVVQPMLEAGEQEALIPAVASPDPVEQSQTQTQSQTTQLPAGGSIAQQYTEQPSSGDQSNGSIYDTATYHQPIEPVAPVKKKTPTSVWIMVGVGLLLLGAIGGAAYFYFTR